MALHGEIKINGGIIGFWYARRLDDLVDPDQVSLYWCAYEEAEEVFGAWSAVTDRVEAVIEHRYSDGAAELAKKVLTLAEGGW